jgi:Holliday junction resolvasome RuvABC endonuclease subunit
MIAIDPTSRGFGFVVFEGPERLIDWAVVETRKDKQEECLRRVAELMGRYRPDMLVLEDSTGRGSRRCPRVQKFINKVQRLAGKESIATRSFSRAKVRQAFSDSGAKTKYEIATVIAKRFPELALRLPPIRKPWMSEDDRMSLFDAASLAFALFSFTERRRHGRSLKV